MAKIRVLLHLEREQYRQLKKGARQLKISLSALVRGYLDAQLNGRRREPINYLEAWKGYIGSFRDKPDVARRHDDYLYGLRK